MPSEFIFRKLTKRDFPAFKKLYKETVQSEFPEYSKRIRDHFTSFEETNRMVGFTIFGAFENNKLVGYMVLLNPEGGVMKIYWLVILKDYQHKGIGTKFLKIAENLGLRIGVHSIQLEADERNVPFYKSRGYEVLGLDKKGYYGTDNYLMKKLIAEPNEDNFLNKLT